MTKYALTGAAGHLGRLTLDALLASGKAAPSDIIAVTRDPSKLADYAAKGVETRAGDFNAPETLEPALKGADIVAVISVDFGDRVRRHMNAVNAAKAVGAQHVLYTSLPRLPGVPVTFGDDHFGTEDAIAASGIAHTFVRNSWYAENLFMGLPQAIKTGTMFSATGDGKLSYAPRQSFADALAGAMLTAGSENRTYTLTGTELFTTQQVVDLANSVLGTSISLVGVTDEQQIEGMTAAGMPDFIAAIVASMDTNIRNGGLDIVTNDIETLSGKTPMALADFLKLSKQALFDAAK